MTTVAVRERGILFSAPMVLALLAGRKTQTRRVVNQVGGRGPLYQPKLVKDGLWADSHCAPFKCPQGQPGDVLWVRETWQALWFTEACSEGFGLGYADDLGEADLEKCRAYLTDAARPTWRKCEPFGVVYKADSDWDDHRDDRGFKWRPSLFMPRWASRITLEITDIRVERVQDISDEDALAEGIEELEQGPPMERFWAPDGDEGHHSASHAYAELWDSINGKRHPWASDPWVWAITFKRVEASK